MFNFFRRKPAPQPAAIIDDIPDHKGFEATVAIVGLDTLAASGTFKTLAEARAWMDERRAFVTEWNAGLRAKGVESLPASARRFTIRNLETGRFA